MKNFYGIKFEIEFQTFSIEVGLQNIFPVDALNHKKIKTLSIAMFSSKE
jgi:hypothetical protein